jgi:hypothetical protein
LLSEPLHGWLDERAAMPSPRGVGPAPFSGSLDPSGLVVADDDDVRAYSVEVLRELDNRVLEAHDRLSALRLLERQEGRVDLLSQVWCCPAA